MIKAAIFDVDGTLLDSMPYWQNAGNIFLESLGIITKENFGKKFLSLSIEESAEYLMKNYVPNMSKNEVVQGIINVMKDSYQNKIPLKNGAEELLIKLNENKIPIVIATATDRNLLESALFRLGINNLIKKTFTCSECKTTKAKPDIYLKACEFLNTKPEETIVFEDTLLPITTASNSSFITVGIKDEASRDDEEKIKEKACKYIEDFCNFDYREMEKKQ